MRQHGGPDMVGVFGHRDVAWRFPWQLTPGQQRGYPNGYSDRGRGDPGDEIFARLRAAGAEALDFDAREDLELWRRRQRKLNGITEQRGACRVIDVDGIAGPATMALLRHHGFASGPELDLAPAV